MKKLIFISMIAVMALAMGCSKQGTVVDGDWNVNSVELQNWDEYFTLYKSTVKADLEAKLAQDSSLMVTEKMKAKEKTAVGAAKAVAVAKLDSTVAALDAQSEALKAEVSKMFETMSFVFKADGSYSVLNAEVVCEDGTFTLAPDTTAVMAMTKDSVEVNYAIEKTEAGFNVMVEKAFAKEGQVDALNTFVHKAKLNLVAKVAAE
jgi:hypothetical protein